MPREQVQWFMKESVHDSAKLHAQQCCTYYSIVNVNKANHPYLSSYEQEQTWTLSRTISNNHKRYQSSIENIHLSGPISSKHVNYENIKIKKDRSNSVLPFGSSSQKYISSTLLYPSSKKMNSIDHQEQQQQQKTLPIKVITNDKSDKKNDSSIKKSRSLNKPMRVIHSNGEFVVRI
jgi:hypothetical protein